MNPIDFSVSLDFLHKSEKLATLGEGTFGSVSLYNTPKGDLVVKETKMQHKSLGYPPDFLNEVDMLVKLLPIQSVVNIKGVCFDNEERKGYLFLEPLKCNLWEWAKRSSFATRIKAIRRLISTIGGALAVMHSFSIVHNDMKTNNILVDESDAGIMFKLADFGKSVPIKSPTVRYCGIQKYRPPTSYNVYHSEIWAFMVVLVEVLLGGHRMVDRSSISDFYDDYADIVIHGRDRFRLRQYLQERLTSDQYQMIPDDFWKFVRPIYHGNNVSMQHLLERIGVQLNDIIVDEVDAIISREVPIQPNYHLVEDKFKRKFRSIGMTQCYPQFLQLYNKFLSLVCQKLQEIDLKYYAEVAFVIIVQKKVKRFEYFPDQDSFLSFQRAFLMTIGYQINIL